MPIFSVVTPVYDGGDTYLLEAYESMSSQRLPKAGRSSGSYRKTVRPVSRSTVYRTSHGSQRVSAELAEPLAPELLPCIASKAFSCARSTPMTFYQMNTRWPATWRH